MAEWLRVRLQSGYTSVRIRPYAYTAEYKSPAYLKITIFIIIEIFLNNLSLLLSHLLYLYQKEHLYLQFQLSLYFHF